MHIVIIEDEPLVQQRILRLTNELLIDKSPKITCFNDIDDAESYLSGTIVDVVLLDLNLHGRDGFDLLKQNVAGAYHTIIISAYADKAIEAFEFGVLDFVAKPFTKERLNHAFNKVLDNQQRSHYGCKYLSIKKAGRIDLVKVEDVMSIQAEGHYSLLQLAKSDNGSNTLLHNKNIDKMMELLPENFCRVHRSYIANMNMVASLIIKEGSRYELLFKNNQSIPVGRTRYSEIRKILDQ